MSKEQLIELAQQIIKQNNLARLSGSLSLVMQGLKVRREPSDIDIWIPYRVEFNPIDGMIKIGESNEYDELHHYLEHYKLGEIKIDVFSPNKPTVLPPRCVVAKGVLPIIVLVHASDILKFKIEHAFDEQIMDEKHREDIIYTLQNNLTPFPNGARAKEKKMSIEEMKSKGLLHKYNISKTNGEPIDDGAEYFILRLDDGGSDPIHIAACRQAVLTYAIVIRNHLPHLSDDLFALYGDKSLSPPPVPDSARTKEAILKPYKISFGMCYGLVNPDDVYDAMDEYTAVLQKEIERLQGVTDPLKNCYRI